MAMKFLFSLDATLVCSWYGISGYDSFVITDIDLFKNYFGFSFGFNK